MKLITQRMLIKAVAARWRKQYEPFTNESPLFAERMGLRSLMTKKEIAERLDILNGETASVDDVANIIGNCSWTRLTCNECDREVDAVIEVGQEPDYESATARLCHDCAIRAAAVMHGMKEMGQ